MSQNVTAAVPSQEKKIYSGTALRIMKLLGAGCSQVEAARACGVIESYVSQLMDEKDFQGQVNDLVRKTMEDQSQIDDNYAEIEKNMSKRLLEQSQFVFDPEKILRIAKFANEAKRKVAIPQQSGEGVNGGNVSEHRAPVTLILPVQVLNEFTINPVGEIVGVNGTELSTLPSKNIDALVAKYKENIKKLPSPVVKRITKNGPGPTDPYSDL